MNDIKLNVATCFRDVARAGYTEVFNVCDGTSSFVPWGVGEWAGVTLLLVGLSMIAIGFVWWNIPYIAWRLRGRKMKGSRV